MAETPAPLADFEVGAYSTIEGRPNPQKLVIEFVPSLAATLLAAESKKGSPLTESEVDAIRDHATVMVSQPQAAKAVEERRGYKDVDPQHAWEEWQVLRVNFGK
jgi:hypothetical protein